jgi:mannose-6-phosphate isomerase-like protein (cupin superfamily)
METKRERRYSLVNFAEITGVDCPCGTAKRAFFNQTPVNLSVHVVEISRDSKKHYHNSLTETYYVLEGSGKMELDDEIIDLVPGMSIMILPGCRHRALGNLKILNVCVPCFDPGDEHMDE